MGPPQVKVMSPLPLLPAAGSCSGMRAYMPSGYCTSLLTVWSRCRAMRRRVYANQSRCATEGDTGCPVPTAVRIN